MIDAISAALAGRPRRRRPRPDAGVAPPHAASPPRRPSRPPISAPCSAQIAADAVEHAEERARRPRSPACTGKASVQQVVEAVMSAEQTLQGAIAIRDKVVAAYLEISRMRSEEQHRESACHRRDRHERPADQRRGDREQHREHQHDRLQALARRVHRPALPGRARRRRAQPRRPGRGPRGRADRPRRAHRRHPQPAHAGRADQHRQQARSGAQRPRLVPGRRRQRRDVLYARRRLQQERRPARS